MPGRPLSGEARVAFQDQDIDTLASCRRFLSTPSLLEPAARPCHALLGKSWPWFKAAEEQRHVRSLDWVALHMEAVVLPNLRY